WYGQKREHGEKPKVENILIMKKELETYSHEIKIIISAALKYDIDDPEQVSRLINADMVWEAPAGSYDDLFVIEIAKKHNAYIVSNDRYLDIQENYPEIKSWLVDRKVQFIIKNGDVFIGEREKLRQISDGEK
ncbi:MAG: hypothetical protein ACFFBD_20400, partial [Candidatus Hodarchaeota archaeon]